MSTEKEVNPEAKKEIMLERLKRSIWPHQVQALEVIEQYLGSAVGGSALIRMPTGTGKSGIIAIVSQFIAKGCVLIVVPWVPLREQLLNEVGAVFWKKVVGDSITLPKQVIEILPSNIKNNIDTLKGKDAIFICNIQTLHDIFKNQNVDYVNLSKLISVIIFDEGHREPAPQWSHLIRNLKLPVVLLTATPYRNDYQIFNVNPKFLYSFSYKNAIEQRYVRDVTFYYTTWRSPAEFVQSLLNYYDNEFSREKPIPDARVIIRCETGDEIKTITNLLKAAEKKVIGVHENFDGNEGSDCLKSDVPNPLDTDYTFWVHQFKLIEGLDDSRFCLLAIYKPLSNARALIQQIGRITRNPGLLSEKKAIVFTNNSDHQKDFWDNYIEYESKYDENPDIYENQSRYELSVKLQPEYWYVERDFRKRIDFNIVDIHKAFRYPKSANCFLNDCSFNLANLQEAIEIEWGHSNIEIRKTIVETNYLFLAYVKYRNSPVLRENSYIEFELGFTICKVTEKYVFFYDSSGMMCKYLSKNLARVDPLLLQGLYIGADARITELTSLNSDIGPNSIRRRTINARSIQQTAPFLNDSYEFPLTSHGYSYSEIADKTVRRYIGYSRGRITDSSTDGLCFDDYIVWLSEVEKKLEEKNKPLVLFNRYAPYIQPPADPTPLSILIDLEEILDAFETKPGFNVNGTPFICEDLHCKVKGNQFILRANSENHVIQLSYESKRKRYTLTSETLDQAYTKKVSADDNIGDSIIGYLNREQSFRIVVKTPGVIYAHHNFYAPKLPNADELLNIFISIDVLGKIGTEKGDRDFDNHTNWDPNSLFGLIDRLGRDTQLAEHMDGITTIICDDMGAEIADFIAIDEKGNRIIFIHAKASKKINFVSPSALQIVFSQAKKNLAYINPMVILTPPSLDGWAKPWILKTDEFYVNNRIRGPIKDPKQVWDKIAAMIHDPSVSREVWVILGQEFSKESFKKASNDNPNSPKIVQTSFLTISTWQAVAQAGASLHVFCSP